jgi:hypothetical protein
MSKKKDPGFHDAWEDPNVKEALKQRDSGHIYLLCCGRCHNYSYYNEGSHFTCQWCDWSVGGDDLDELLENGEAITLDEYTEMQVDADEGIP